MQRKIALCSIVLTAVFFHFCLAHAQIAEKEKEWEKTITLPSGEVIYDLNGEWAAYLENYGPWEGYGNYPDIVKIKQKDASFVGIKQIGSPWNPKGNEWIKGELDKNGFKKIQIISGVGPLDAKGQILPWYGISKQIIVDDGEKARATLIRR